MLTGEFGGTDRFEVLRLIGAGGMGMVYEAHDRERGQRVALKTIPNPGSDTIYRLKREFRVLADLSHPNLAVLYDLVIEERGCFFTMELIDGRDFLEWVRARPDGAPIAYAQTISSQSSDEPTARHPSQEADAAPGEPTAPALPVGLLPRPCDEARLRAALKQLGLGLEALHASGKIHRDIKPSNLLVTPEGRVVLLDFGLAVETGDHHDDERGTVVGTVGYMAPEQAAGDWRLTPAADWYSVGVLLYEALTGRLPFDGSTFAVMRDKQRRAPPAPHQIVPQVPSDLDELCMALLARVPEERPSGAEVLRRLGLERELPPRVSRSRDHELAGREAELEALTESLRASAEGRAACAVVRGVSGIGKSALVHRLLERARLERPDTVILTGRCYERESVPYKAMDSLIDRLSAHWLALPRKEAEAILPKDAALLATLFPVLGRVPAVANAPRPPEVADTQEQRTRAFGVLRELFTKMAERHPLILFLDDLQWVDADTVTLLSELMRAPDPPALLLLLTTRIEGSEAVLELQRRTDCERRLIEVGPLDARAAAELVAAQLGDDPAALALGEKIAREAKGSPLYLLELARYLHGRSAEEIHQKGLDEVLLERVDGLGDEARALVEVVAVAGEPLALRAAGLAAELSGEALARTLALLRAQRFVRAAGGRADDQVEPYHDRVREAIAHRLPESDRARLHRAIATALTGQAPAARLARHWLGAGEKTRAADYARRAAEEATATLDFDRAAGLYRMALDLGAHTREERRELRTRLGTALGNAGRPVEASREFAAASEDSDATLGLELRRRAADALLRGGYLEEGLAATRAVLGEVGLSLPKTAGRAIASLLARRALLRVRGLGFRPRSLKSLSQPELTRVDVCEGVALGLVMVDTFRSMDFSARFLHSALELGEPWRIARAFALEADFLAVQAKVDRAEALYTRLEALTRELGTPQAEAQLLTTRGVIDFLCYNRWRIAHETLSRATAIFQTHQTTAGPELDTVGLFLCWALYYLGELGELGRRVSALVQAAARSGDRYAAVTFRAAFPSVWLARDKPDEGEREVAQALADWALEANGFQLQHLFALTSRCDLAIYRGEPERARPLLEAARAPLSRSLLDRAPSNRLLWLSALGRVTIACGAHAQPGSTERKGAAAQTRQIARKLASSRPPAGRASAGLLLAGAAELDGDLEGAVAELRRAIEALSAIDTRLYAESGRRRLGLLVGGDEGRALIAEADRWLTAHGVAHPEKIAAMLAPGAT